MNNADIVVFLPALIIKLVAATLLFLHLLFSLIVARQTKLMLSVVEARISPFIFSFAIIHLALSLFLFLWTLLFL